MRYTTMESPIGELTLTGGEHALTGVYMGEAPVTADWRRDPEPLAEAVAQLEQYFAGERTGFELALAPRGTEFMRRVWDMLEEIPYGETTTYGALALRLGNPRTVRAVGLANGRNPLPIIVPCHRVIGADGSLVGFGGGLERKRLLLAHEAEVREGFRSTLW
jgi:methylated-DNA-[protein]-cysteine S-methyltransferase